MSAYKPDAYGEDVRGMPCCCDKGHCGDGHFGCYYEALFWQRRKDIVRPTTTRIEDGEGK